MSAPSLWGDSDGEGVPISNNNNNHQSVNLAPMKTWQKVEESNKLLPTPIYTEEKSPYKPPPARDELLFPHVSRERVSSPEDRDDGNDSLCSEEKMPAETLPGKC